MYISFIVYAVAAYNVFVTDSVKAYVPQICYIQNVEGIVDGTYECTEGYRTCITEELEDGYVVKNCWDDDSDCHRRNIRCCHSDYCNVDDRKVDDEDAHNWSAATISAQSLVIPFTATSAVTALARL